MDTDTQDSSDVVEYACAACHTRNRIPRRRVSEDPKCGQCHRPLFPRQPVAVTSASWRAEVEDSPIPVLVDFWAPWCGPCLAVAPVLERIAAERAGKLKVVKLNVDENQPIATRFAVRSIPKLLLLRGPLEVAETVGAASKATLDGWLDRYL